MHKNNDDFWGMIITFIILMIAPVLILFAGWLMMHVSINMDETAQTIIQLEIEQGIILPEQEQEEQSELYLIPIDIHEQAQAEGVSIASLLWPEKFAQWLAWAKRFYLVVIILFICWILARQLKYFS